MFKDILVGVDECGGPDAIVLAKTLISANGRITLAHVARRDSYLAQAIAAAGPDATRSYEQARRDDALQLLGSARDRSLTDESGLDVELRYVSSGSVGRGLHELAEETGADLIVLGSSRRGLLGRVLLGDDTRAALNGAQHPSPSRQPATGTAPRGSKRSGSGTTGRPKASTR